VVLLIRSYPNKPHLDQYGDTTVIEKEDGWFRDETTVTETDRYGDTTVTEDDSWF
jgi:hypothetical protein